MALGMVSIAKNFDRFEWS